MILGCAWYPEHWDESRWADDIRLMREANISLVRVGEFAWSRLEPQDGQMALDWLERAVTLATAQGMMVVLGTPTAAPPAWLTQAHPEVLAIREDGRPEVHGARGHFNPASATYRTYCARIAGALAERFGKHPQVIGWQIDNEYNHVSYDAETLAQWQAWLMAKYGTLDALNSHWTTSYWSQEYTDWSQLPFPLRAGHNPGLTLDWKRFVTDLLRSYQKTQIDAIRQFAEPRQWITHNFMGWFDLFDHYKLCEDLEIASWDNYVGTGHLNYLSNGAAHDLTRGFKRRNFLVLETQPGSVNWAGVNNALDRGEVRCMAWHAVGHGAEVVSYWQWRSALNGQEQYHGCLVAPDGNPRPLYEEVSKLGKEFTSVAKFLRGTTPASEVAILHSYDDRWAINGQRFHKDFDPVEHLLSFYRPLRAMSFGVDILHPSAPLSAYKLVIAPHLHLVDDEISEHHSDFYELKPCRMDPKPVQPTMPLHIGGESDAALRRVARLGTGWHSFDRSPDELASGLVDLDRHLEAAGRTRDEIAITVCPYTKPLDPSTVAAYGDAGADAVAALFLALEPSAVEPAFDDLEPCREAASRC